MEYLIKRRYITQFAFIPILFSYYSIEINTANLNIIQQKPNVFNELFKYPRFVFLNIFLVKSDLLLVEIEPLIKLSAA